MRFRHLTLLVAAAALSLLACPKPVTTPPPKPIEKPAPPPIRIPEGCEENLSGDYSHEKNPAYRYRADDDGGTLFLLVQRPAPDGGSIVEDAGAFISLTRTPNGFVGVTDAVVFTQRGASCRVAFPTDVQSCFDGGISLRAASSASVDETCAVPQKAAPSPRVEHRLLRVVEQPPDAGAPDAGAVFSDAGKPDGG